MGERAADQSLQEEDSRVRSRSTAEAISNAAGDSNYVRVQVLTPVNVLSREKQLGKASGISVACKEFPK
jgi:hypothetical protein